MGRRARTLFLACGAAIALLGGSAVASGGDVLRPPHRAPFVPRTGDWEGIDHGFHASFQLVVNAHNRIYGAPGYGLYDLTTTVPDCPLDPGAFATRSEGSAKLQVLVSPAGAFPFRQGKQVGSFTASAQATVSQNGRRPCLPRMMWHLHPAHRLPVSDGRWSIRFADGEQQSQSVSEGGRVTALGLPNATPSCPDRPGPTAEGGITVFIPANRRVDQSLNGSSGLRLRAVWNFISSRTGDGRFIATAPGCSPGVLAFTSHLVK